MYVYVCRGVGGEYVGTFTGRFYTEYSKEISDYSSATSEYPSRVTKENKRTNDSIWKFTKKTKTNTKQLNIYETQNDLVQ